MSESRPQTTEYRIWAHMKSRCNNPNVERYPHYGGRGIKVCDRWNNYSNFLSDMGRKPAGHSIERVNVDGNYEPSNCRWIPLSRQAHNKTNSAFIFECGNRITMTDFSRKYGIPVSTLFNRIDRGITDVEFLKKKSLMRRGEESTRAKLTTQNVNSVRKQFSEGVIVSQIARNLGVSHGCIQGIIKKRTWNDAR